MKKPSAVTLFIALLVSAAAPGAAVARAAQADPQAAAAQSAPPEVKLPDTAAGRIAADFLKIVNSGTDKEFLDFFVRNASEAALKRLTDDQRIQMYHQMKDSMGRLTVRRVQASGDVGIILVAETEKDGWVQLEFNLQPAPPHKLDSIRIEDADASAGGAPPAPPGPPPGATPPPGGPPGLKQPPPAAPLPDEKLKALAGEFITRAEAFGFSGGVLFSRQGQVLLERSCGLADRARGVPVSASTAFDIGSNTKDFTKMAVLQLADAGKLRLDDPISKYIEGVPPDKAAITIAQLLNHTAGLPEYSGNDDEALTRDDFLKRILAAHLVADPGSEQNYSNPGYSLLAAIIEKVTGGSWEAYASEHIFKPAGMAETGYALPKWKPGQIAHSYADGRDAGSTFDYPHAPDGPNWNLRGNGGTLATLGDMYKFHLALAGETLLKTESKEKLFPQTKPVVLVGGNGVHFFCYHREPAAGLAILVASTDSSMRAMDMDAALLAIATGRAVELPPAVVKPAPGTLDRLAGTYALASGAKLIVTALKDRLAIVADGQDATSLLAGLEPELVSEAERLNARALSIAETSARGDYEQLANAFGGGLSAAEFKARADKMRLDREARLGAFKGVRVLGSIPARLPHGRPAMEATEGVTLVAIEHERGAVYTRYIWGEEGLVGERQFTSAPATEFLPVSTSRFASYNLAAGSGNEIAFELDAAGRPSGLSFGIGAMRAIAKRVG